MSRGVVERRGDALFWRWRGKQQQQQYGVARKVTHDTAEDAHLF
jgi:hypothetical protein